MIKQLSEEQIKQNQELVMKLIHNMHEPRMSLVRAMLDGPVGDEYFMAPASTQVDFHSCFVGGLCHHSLNVVKSLKKLTDALCPGKFSNQMISFVGLFHDLGKVGDGSQPYYVSQTSDWHREKLGKLYEINKKCVNMPTSERGLFVLQHYGIELTSDEYLAIRLNDGPGVPENGPYKMREPELAMLLHWADRWATEQEKSELAGPQGSSSAT
jgi:hypothetical protein